MPVSADCSQLFLGILRDGNPHFILLGIDMSRSHSSRPPPPLPKPWTQMYCHQCIRMSVRDEAGDAKRNYAGNDDRARDYSLKRDNH